MAQKKRFVTPIGTAKFPWLNTPDTKWDPQGKFKVTLLVDPNENADFLALLDQIAEEAYQKGVAKLKKAKKMVQANQAIKKPLYAEEYDENGEPTGLVEVKFTSNASYRRKDGQEVKLKPALFDAEGKPMGDNAPRIWGGSKIRINFTPFDYYLATTKEAAASLKINAVQVIELVTEGGASADSYGFDSVEGGFSSNSYNGGYADEDDDDFSFHGSDEEESGEVDF